MFSAHSLHFLPGPVQHLENLKPREKLAFKVPVLAALRWSLPASEKLQPLIAYGPNFQQLGTAATYFVRDHMVM
jgi:hypothetical protein